MFKKIIITEFFTTVSFKQMIQSLYLIFFGFYKLKYGKEQKEINKIFLQKIKTSNTKPKFISFYNGRSAIFHALKIIGLNKNDEVIVNAYNCVSVCNAVIQSGAKIIYSDINIKDLSFNLEKLKLNINKNTKVIILQHTFGKISNNYDNIINFAKKNNIIVIEDYAHSLGNKAEIKGDFAIFSTGRDKVISSVTGGFLIINNNTYFNKVEKMKNILIMPNIILILKNLNYNIIGYLAYKTYSFINIGKILIFLSRKLKLITEILAKNEKTCNFNNFYLDFPNSLAYLTLKELNSLEKYNNIRLKNTRYYLEKVKNKKINFIFKDLNNYNGFRFPILLSSEKEKNKLLKIAKEKNILLGTSWGGTNIVPIGTNLKKSKYKIGSCPIAEDISKRILTLPNHKLINKRDLERVINLLNNF